MTGNRFQGKTPLPDCVWKRPCPQCGARQGALCFNLHNRAMTTGVHYRRRDGYQPGRAMGPVHPEPRVVPFRRSQKTEES